MAKASATYPHKSRPKTGSQKSHKKNQWPRWSRTLHWSSSALGLMALLFFSITGVTLNHPGWFNAHRDTQSRRITMPAGAQKIWRNADDATRLQQLLTVIKNEFSAGVPQRIDRDEMEWFFDYPRPGGVASVIYDIPSGKLTYETTNDGFIALINDLHKGRHSGKAWSLFIDAAGLLGFFISATGLALLIVHAPKRTTTWPLVGLGVALPLGLYWIFVP